MVGRRPLNMKTNNMIKRLLAVLAAVVIVAAIVCFELFNFGTNRDVLDGIFGNVVFLTLSAGTWLAAGACLVDFGGLSRIFTSETNMRQESIEIKAVTLGWFFASIFNAWLTFVWVSYRLEGGAAALPRNLADDTFAIAVAIAVFVFLVRLVLIFGGATVGDRVLRLPFNTPHLPRRARGGNPKPLRMPMPEPMSFSSKPPK